MKSASVAYFLYISMVVIVQILKLVNDKKVELREYFTFKRVNLQQSSRQFIWRT